MTTAWTITREWEGETVAVLGAGPDMTSELAASARGHKTIAVNRAIQFAPDADMFVALDPRHPFWEAAEGFKGLSTPVQSGIVNDEIKAALAAAGLPVVVVNPAQVRAFATALGRRAKTDPIDARVIAQFAAYALDKKFSKYKDEIGHGAIEGVAGQAAADEAQSDYVGRIGEQVRGDPVDVLRRVHGRSIRTIPRAFSRFSLR